MFSKDIVIFIPSILEAEKIFNIQGFQKNNHFYSSTYNGHTVIITGVGKTNSAITSALFHSQYSTHSSILTGICGAYEESGLNIGDIVCIEKDYLVDESNYNGENITTLNEKGFLKDDEYCGIFKCVNDFKSVTSNTVSLIANEKQLVKKYMDKTKALVENMEGAAFGIAANRFNVHPYQIRAVSNYASVQENQKWDIKKACKNLREAVDFFIKSLVQ